MIAIVSNMLDSCYSESLCLRDPLRGPRNDPPGSCTASAARHSSTGVQLECRKGWVALVLVIALATAHSASAQNDLPLAAQPDEHPVADIVKFLAGGGA